MDENLSKNGSEQRSKTLFEKTTKIKTDQSCKFGEEAAKQNPAAAKIDKDAEWVRQYVKEFGELPGFF